MDEKKPKEIKRFKLLDVSGSYLSKAYRVALAPLLAVTRPALEQAEADQRQRILSDAVHLVHFWRHRLNLLAAHGWSPVQEPLDYLYAANCPPVGVRTNHKNLWTCKHRSICPFCWCRQYVQEAYWRFERALYVNQQTDVPYPYSLVLVKTDRHYPAGPDAWPVEDVLRAFVQPNKGAYYKQRMGKALGATVLCSVEPPRPKMPNPCWTVQHRILAVVREDDLDDYYEEPDLGQHENDDGAWAVRSVERFPHPRRAVLAGAIGKYAEYPTLMLTGGLKNTIAVYNACTPEVRRTASGKIKKENGLRLSAVYGVLRGKLEIPDEDHEQIPIKSMESPVHATPTGKPTRRTDRGVGTVSSDS